MSSRKPKPVSRPSFLSFDSNLLKEEDLLDADFGTSAIGADAEGGARSGLLYAAQRAAAAVASGRDVQQPNFRPNPSVPDAGQHQAHPAQPKGHTAAAAAAAAAALEQTQAPRNTQQCGRTRPTNNQLL